MEVTNRALLKNLEQIDILVDDSPPVDGVVMKGPTGGPGIDYSSDNTIIAHWYGLIDHESGVKIYTVGIGDRCLTRTELLQRNVSQYEFSIKETSETVTRLPLKEEGKHYVIVIAYNNAMEPSATVCSDGATKDDSPTSLRNMSLKSASTAETVVYSEGTAWLIHGNVSAVLLVNTTTCFQRCKLSSPNAFRTSSKPRY